MNQSTGPAGPELNAPASTSSFDQKPDSGGTPAIER